MKIGTPRRITQILIFLLFIFLFINTRYSGKDILKYPVNIFFKLDPLIAISTMLFLRSFISSLAYSFLFILATIFLGRFFCGWFCPLGTFLDIFDYFFLGKRPVSNSSIQWEKINRIKYYILIFLLISSFITIQFIWLFDPLSILFRTFTISFFPIADFFLKNLADFLYNLKLEFLFEHINKLNKIFFSIKPHIYQLDIFIFSFFIAILLLELMGRRFWCRVICPLGALFELTAVRSLVNKRIDKKLCNDCNKCIRECKMGNIDCVLCFNCKEICPTDAIEFDFYKNEEISGINLSRRTMLLGSISTILVMPAFKISSLLRIKNRYLIRPPGAVNEQEFLGRCTRCGECMKVCITNGLNPTLLEAGIEGLWSPKLVPRQGYCEYNCSLCGQTCPTGAIQELPIEIKRKTKIGLAYIDRNRCIPWRKYVDCLVCEEHCPVPDKAIKFKITEKINIKGEKVSVKEPHIIENLCIGCGICENKCPVENSAIITVADKKDIFNV